MAYTVIFNPAKADYKALQRLGYARGVTNIPLCRNPASSRLKPHKGS